MGLSSHIRGSTSPSVPHKKLEPALKSQLDNLRTNFSHLSAPKYHHDNASNKISEFELEWENQPPHKQKQMANKVKELANKHQENFNALRDKNSLNDLLPEKEESEEDVPLLPSIKIPAPSYCCFWKTHLANPAIKKNDLINELNTNEIKLDEKIDSMDNLTAYSQIVSTALICILQTVKLSVNSIYKDNAAFSLSMDILSIVLPALTTILSGIGKKMRDDAIKNKEIVLESKKTLQV